VQTLDERCVDPYEDVAGGREPPGGLVGSAASLQVRGYVVPDDHEQIVIAFHAGCASRARAEESDAPVLAGLDQAARDLGRAGSSAATASW